MNQLNDPSTDPRATADQAGAARASAGLPRVAVVGRPNVGKSTLVNRILGRRAGELLDAVVARLGAERASDDAPELPALAIVGRPNVGKSSLLNRLAGAELAIVAETPGTTRDTVDSVVVHDGRGYRVVDTAGMRRSLARAEGADYFALVRSMEAVDRADLALLVLEGPVGVAEQDQKVAARAVEAGCGLVLLANKWDLMDEDARRAFKADLEHRLWFVEWAPLLRVSARTGRGVDRIWRQVDTALAERARRVPTAALNQWLAAATGRTPPPPSRGRAVKVRYVTQARVDPPDVEPTRVGPCSQLVPPSRSWRPAAAGPCRWRAGRCGGCGAVPACGPLPCCWRCTPHRRRAATPRRHRPRQPPSTAPQRPTCPRARPPCARPGSATRRGQPRRPPPRSSRARRGRCSARTPRTTCSPARSTRSGGATRHAIARCGAGCPAGGCLAATGSSATAPSRARRC